jgi:hypothetical protein
MSKTFRDWSRDQALLLPPSVHDFHRSRKSILKTKSRGLIRRLGLPEATQSAYLRPKIRWDETPLISSFAM